MKYSFTIIAWTIVLALGCVGCSWFDNQTTYFNTYYNMERIRAEVMDEFSYQDQNRRVKPRVLVPGLDSAMLSEHETKTAGYNFLKAFVIDRTKLQPVATKVDSILIKGSKVLANHPKSNYVQGSLFLMAEAYFFRQEWIPSQQKCLELIERFDDGDYSPDAHLLLSKDYLLQKKVSLGKQMLSRTIDVAWYKDRYDILSEAYRIQAELALEEGDLDKAVQPYKQAVAQCEDDEQRARWQVDVAALYYRIGKYKLAEEAFTKVFDYTPDILAEFEAQLYRAACLGRLGDTLVASKMLDELDRNKNYSEWASFVVAERLALARLSADNVANASMIAQERKADTTFIGRPELMAQAFQKGMALYKSGRYEEALAAFAKAKVVRTPVYEVSAKYFALLKQWEDQTRKVAGFKNVIIEKESMRDSIAMMTAKEVYGLARVHENLGNQDSALFYYRMAYDSTSRSDRELDKYLYAQARLLSVSEPDVSDSLFMVLAERYPKSVYGREAGSAMGFTSESVIDDAAELFKSGTSFRRIKDWAFASRQYNSIVHKFETSAYAPKALYALGWMFEREAARIDSALYYYGQLIERYPRSEYAREIRPSVEYALAKMNNVDVSDSVLLRDLDDDLNKRAKAGEKGILDQMIDNNKDALQFNGPNVNLPNIPGLNGADSTGGSINDIMRRNLQNMNPIKLPGQNDSTNNGAPPFKKP